MVYEHLCVRVEVPVRMERKSIHEHLVSSSTNSLFYSLEIGL